MTNDVKQAIDWSKALEAYHEDGRVVAAEFMCHALGDTADVRFNGRFENALKPSGYVGHGWRIRNVTPAEATPTIPAALVERMVGLLRGMNADDIGVHAAFTEARAIVADPGFPVEVDPDLVEARKLAAEVEDYPHGSLEDLALAALRRGRALARGEG